MSEHRYELIIERNGPRDLDVTVSRDGFPFAGASDSTGTLSLADLLRQCAPWVLNDMERRG